jgi:4-hydroxy-tetrahydrodipicolinate reductase
LRFSVSGIVAGSPMLVVNHVTRIGPEMGPSWPTIGSDGGYRVEIDSFPPFKGEFPMGLPGGTGSTFADAMAMTAGRCVNCVEPVVNAKPGYRTFLDLGPLGGRHALQLS